MQSKQPDLIHPSQRRTSCEACKKYKKKCIRVKPDDPTCIKCASLGIFCDPGQRKRVGRPKGRTDGPYTAAEASKRQSNGAGQAQELAHADADKFRSVLLPPRQPASTIDVPGWPTFMTDIWYRSMGLDTGLASRQMLSTNNNNNASRSTSSMVETSSRQAFAISVLGIRSAALPTSFEDSPLFGRGPTTIASTATRPPTYHIHGDQFSHMPRRLVLDVDIANAAPQLARMIESLQLRRLIINLHRRDLTLDTTIYRRGPLFLDNDTLASMVLETSEDLLQIMSSLLHQQQKDKNVPFNNLGALINTLTEVYRQLLSFYELFVELLIARVERLADPMIAIPGMALDDVPVNSLSAQGALFCNTSLHLLRRLDRVLGIGPECEGGLLVPDQIRSLWAALDSDTGLTAGNAVARPADIIKLFSQLLNVLEKISASASRV